MELSPIFAVLGRGTVFFSADRRQPEKPSSEIKSQLRGNSGLPQTMPGCRRFIIP